MLGISFRFLDWEPTNRVSKGKLYQVCNYFSAHGTYQVRLQIDQRGLKSLPAVRNHGDGFVQHLHLSWGKNLRGQRFPPVTAIFSYQGFHLTHLLLDVMLVAPFFFHPIYFLLLILELFLVEVEVLHVFPSVQRFPGQTRRQITAPWRTST